MSATVGGGKSTDHHAWMTAVANPWVMLIAGAVLGVIWIFVTQLTINTSEVFYLTVGFGEHLQSGQITLMQHFNLIDQFIAFWSGANNSAQEAALFYAWIQEIITDIFALGIVNIALQVTHAKAKISAGKVVAIHARARDIAFILFTIGLFCFDSFTDYLYASGNDIAKSLFTVCIGLATFFLLPLSILCFKAAFAMLGWIK